MRISVIIPVYNEAKTIREIIQRVKNTAIVDELVIVDDYSTDGTREILKEESQRDQIKVYYHEKNRGKGAAILTAVKHITGDIVIFQDADLEYDPNDYIRIVKPILNGMADVVYGSRFLNRKDFLHCKKFFYLTHFIGNKLLNFLVNILYRSHLTDMETCYKAMKKEILKNMRLSARGFEIEPEITVKILKGGFKIHEVPISYYPRDYEEGKKVTWKDGIDALYILLKCRFTKKSDE